MGKSILSVLLALTLTLTCFPAASAESQGLTLYMPCITRNNAQTEFCDYASRLLQDAGMDITFKVFTTSGAVYADAYTDFITDHSLDDNAAFAAPTAMLESLCDDGWFADVQPLSLAVQPVNRVALLIKTDLLERYGAPIRTSQQLQEWLYTRHSETGATPLVAAPFVYDRTYAGYTWLNLILPEAEYFALNNEFSFAAGADIFASTDGSEFFVSTALLPVVKHCADRWLRWIDDGLLQLYTLRVATGLDKFDAVLVNTEDFLAPLMLANNKPLSQLDFSEYSIQIFYAEEQPRAASETIPSPYYGVCASPAAQPLLDEFLTWLSAPENYLLLRYGLEGVDYTWEDNRLNVCAESDYALWEQRVLFERSDLEPALRRENIPVNLENELALLENAPAPLFSTEALTELSEILIDDGHTVFLAETAAKAHSVWEGIHGASTVASARNLLDQWLESGKQYAAQAGAVEALLREYLSVN